ncbi:MAG: hypothetical protein K0U98_08925 [Deltaproteobacteria bacterium]|nr:hypothetical protein [Deltaproteobacteria bacterium]
MLVAPKRVLCAVAGVGLAIGISLLATETSHAEEATVDGATQVEAALSRSLLAAEEEQDSEGTEAEAKGSYWKDHFRLHGYLTTAYQELDPDEDRPFETSDQLVLGLDEDGTFDYRIAALQLRYDPTPKNTVIVQLSHRKLGNSPLTEDIDEDVELDWAFYQFRFTDNTSVKVGRVPTPVGIFNEYRDVGTLLPFFRPSFNFYREGSFVSETVDGVLLSHRIGATSDWGLDIDAYYGEWDHLEAGSARNDAVTQADVSDGYGAQFWLRTPVEGLRFGLGGQSYTVSEASGFNNAEADWDSWYASIDAVFEKLIARAEYKWLEFPVDNSVFVGGEAEIINYYFQLGWLFNDKFSLYGQQEFGDVEQDAIGFASPAEFNQREDLGFSLVYSILPNLVLKAEYHEQAYELAGFPFPVFDSSGAFLGIEIPFTEFEDEYSIISLSVSF